MNPSTSAARQAGGCQSPDRSACRTTVTRRNQGTNVPRSPETSKGRWFLKDCGVGLGAIASAVAGNVAAAESSSLVNPLALRMSHFAAKAKRT